MDNGRLQTVQALDLHVLRDTARNGRFSPRLDQSVVSIMCSRNDILPAANDDEVVWLGMPLHIAEMGSPGRLGVLEITEGQYRFRMLEGRLQGRGGAGAGRAAGRVPGALPADQLVRASVEVARADEARQRSAARRDVAPARRLEAQLGERAGRIFAGDLVAQRPAAGEQQGKLAPCPDCGRRAAAGRARRRRRGRSSSRVSGRREIEALVIIGRERRRRPAPSPAIVSVTRAAGEARTRSKPRPRRGDLAPDRPRRLLAARVERPVEIARARDRPSST